MNEHAVPPDLGTVYENVNMDVISLHATWSVYRSLYELEEIVTIMTRLAPFASRTIQDALDDAVLLQITRLCDPARSGKKKNLTLERLIDELPTDASPGLISTLKSTLTEIKGLINTLVAHRNQRIAHTDLDIAVDSETELPDFSSKTIENALDKIRDFMNTINLKFHLTTTLYEDPVVQGGGDAVAGVFKLAAKFLAIQEQARRPDANPDKIFEAVKRPGFD